MLLKDVAILNEIPHELVRYASPDKVNNGMISRAVFELREDRTPPKPPEEYISFFHSSLCSIGDKISDVAKKMQGKLSPKKNGWFLFLNACDAHNEINRTNSVINFKQLKYPKYGMYYITEDETLISEAITTLLLLSEESLYQYKDYIGNNSLN
jgi:hypothetical protein